MFTFDVDAVKQTFVVVDSLFHNSICQKLKASLEIKGLKVMNGNFAASVLGIASHPAANDASAAGNLAAGII